ncbi:cytochrome P450 [Nocardia cyriacigeorgica]|uniref:Cytochrome P450 n=2 Tax=Nocardia cyriacigeorgica TaxID=135487 RepID=A0A6P1D9X9_9NOCA|nr:cytochrome P450 [Nocardia cyriacigeorgica]NEW41909.1 cytochrome P450 [Nocardia cyriacigeorgica]NEW46429.1 cytochrome P450 [Nocardia cyriacigeorgica]NEW53060.1 cytochrome P450 [Nocardia cyriacigeorgica]NEW57043.1 cytochrome P450 [Nocardia cyriacigeorgica]
MSTANPWAQASACPVLHGAPTAADDDPRVPLYTPEFANDPHHHYREMRRRYGSLAPVELAPDVPATLVLGYSTAVRILNDPGHFPADPRAWQQNIPADCPILPLLEWRPMASRSTGADFVRYRQAITSSIDIVDLYTLNSVVENIAVPLINGFCADGQADLIRQYVFPLVFDVVNFLLGCPGEIGEQVAAGTAALLEGVDAEKGSQLLGEALMQLVVLKRAEPDNDITSVLLQHEAALDDVEASHHVSQVYGAGIEFQLNLISNTLLLILRDERFGGSVLGGNLSSRDALDEVLFNDPPLANLLITYPRQPILIDEVWLPAHQPVVISMAACNNDPEVRSGELLGNRSHLAWGVGQHACPAQSLAYLIAQDAIDQLLDALPDLRLDFPDGEPAWRPGPFHRALAELPVTFPPAAPLNI